MATMQKGKSSAYLGARSATGSYSTTTTVYRAIRYDCLIVAIRRNRKQRPTNVNDAVISAVECIPRRHFAK